MSDFVKRPLDKRMNKQNFVSRIENVERLSGARPSRSAESLADIAERSGVLIGDLIVSPASGVTTIEPTDSGFTGVFMTGDGRVFSSSTDTWNLGGVNAGVLQFGVSASDGKAYAGAGNVILDTNGVSVNTASGTYADRSAYKFVNGSTVVGSLSSFQSGTQNVTRITTEATSASGFIQLYSYGTGGGFVWTEIQSYDGTNTMVSRFKSDGIDLNSAKHQNPIKLWGSAGPRPVIQVQGSNNLPYAGDGDTLYPMWIPVTKPSDESVQSDTSVNVDSHLKFSMLANTKYAIKIVVYFSTPAAADFKFDVNGPAGPNQVFGVMKYIDPAGVATNDVRFGTYAGSATSILSAGTSVGFIQIEMIVDNGANAGTFAFRWAQVTSTASNTTVFGASHLQYTPALASL